MAQAESIKKIEQELIEIGKIPDEYNIKISEHGYSISPKTGTLEKELIRAIVNPTTEIVATLGNELAELKISNIKKANIIDYVGEELSRIKLQSIVGGEI